MANITTRSLNFSRITSDNIENNIVRISTTKKSDISASPRLLNWVEPVNIGGYTKSCFYTEVDSNLKVGDRVFIINGVYDSNELISIDKYKRGRDGYKILQIDRCKIVLDIDYTGDKPWMEDSIDNFIKIFYVRNQREFDYINSQFISRDFYVNKYESGQNNFIFCEGSYNGILSGIGQNSGVSGAGFWYRTGTTWNQITPDLLTNSSFFQSLLSTNFQNNGRIKVINSSFNYLGKEWREDIIYKFQNGEWNIDIKYIRPFITKSNFRRGDFRGNWNLGIYGSYNEKIKWTGIDSLWNNGTTINSKWIGGDINSNYSPSQSYFTEIDEFGLPVQKINIQNNGGFGYNYFIDMDILSSTINNGNYIHCNIGTLSSTFSAVEGYYQNWNSSMTTKSNNGQFLFCNIRNSNIKGSVIKFCKVENSNIELSKSINSQFKESVFYKSNYDSDNIIKIRDYDEWSVNIDPYSTSNGWKIYKFYVSESDIERIKSLDKFTIRGLNISVDDYNSTQYEGILNFFDRMFILDGYKDADDILTSGPDESTQVQRDLICKISTKAENTFKIWSYYSGGSYSMALTSSNDKLMPSVDIILKVDNTNFDNHDYNTSFPSSPTSSSILGNNINISNAYIIDSYYDSGLFEQSNWNSGYFYNYNFDNRIGGTFSQGQLLLSYTNSQIHLQIPDNTLRGINDEYFKINDIVYLNGVDYNNGYSVTRLPSIYKISNIFPGPGYDTLVLDEYLIGTTISVIPSLTGSGVFLTSPDGLTSSIIGTNRYNYLHKLLINNSTIKTGILRRSYISNSKIEYDKFNNSDYIFENKGLIKELMIVNSIFSKSGNIIKSGIIVDSYFNSSSDKWENGIFWKSIWESGIFNNGVARETDWINGVFKGGIFYNSKSSYFIDKYSAYYKSGDISTTSNNNIRKSWKNGVFENGDFYESIWEDGVFQNGRFYKSSWCGGLFNNGVFGDDRFNLTDNNFYSGTFSNGVAINSNFYSGWIESDPTIGPTGYPGNFNGIHWLNGTFQSGLFSNNINNPSASSIWYNGSFNGGDFTNTSIWLNGTFNDGKFTSYYGCTAVISNNESDYSWRGGIFNGGEFGTSDGLTNSTWWTGEMYGGIFRGKIWNNGILISGEFHGSATISCIGGISASNASQFVDGFSYSYWGLWRDGFITDIKDKFIKDREIFTNIIRFKDDLKFSERVNKNKVIIKNALWLSGTFSHRSGETDNIVWLDGTFESGKFKNSSFNPYVKRGLSTQPSFNLNDTCIWKDGTFEGGDFYISKWEKGMFNIGNAHGMLWKNGVCNYMNAFNICWENGLWRNGNWYGSSFTFDGVVNDDFTKQILFRLMNDCTGTSSCHIWNIFEDVSDDEVLFINATASTPQVFQAVELPPIRGRV